MPFVYPAVSGDKRGAKMSREPVYKRVLLKASGEALMGSQGFGIDVAVADRIAADIAEARQMGVEVGVVVGGGNIFRGVAVASKGGDREHLVRETADLWFHCLVMLSWHGVPLAEVLAELERREGRSGIEEKASRPKGAP